MLNAQSRLIKPQPTELFLKSVDNPGTMWYSLAMIRIVEMGPDSTPILAPEWDKADREGTLEALLEERKYVIRYEASPEKPKHCRFCGK